MQWEWRFASLDGRSVRPKGEASRTWREERKHGVGVNAARRPLGRRDWCVAMRSPDLAWVPVVTPACTSCRRIFRVVPLVDHAVLRPAMHDRR